MKQLKNPVWHAVALLFCLPLYIVIQQPESTEEAWFSAGGIYAIFIFINSTLVLFCAQRPWKYFLLSIGLSFGFVLASALITQTWISIARIPGGGEAGMIFLIVLYHPVALLLMMSVRWALRKLTKPQ